MKHWLVSLFVLGVCSGTGRAENRLWFVEEERTGLMESAERYERLVHDVRTDAFSAVNAYYHIDQSQRYVQAIGFNDIQNASVTVNPQAFSAGAVRPRPDR